jgi:restriction endonuclease S subunit
MSGAANVALSVAKIQSIEIPLPPLEKQQEIVRKYKSIVREEDELKSELNYQQSLIKQLRQQILQEAIEGTLTADWRVANPDVKPASELLKRIAAEKAQLIKDKKIKPQQPFPPITEDEKPFELPDGWACLKIEYFLQYTKQGMITCSGLHLKTPMLAFIATFLLTLTANERASVPTLPATVLAFICTCLHLTGRCPHYLQFIFS